MLSLGLDFLGVDEDELLEDDLGLVFFELELFVVLLLALFEPFSVLENAASSIFLLVLDGLLDPEEDLVGFSRFNLEDDC